VTLVAQHGHVASLEAVEFQDRASRIGRPYGKANATYARMGPEPLPP
jgi:hypothetical protein